ncbi:ABC transporter substrate binding protein [Candidatus Uabimicrobium sp. HlEnr_7]|uniref:ABC transporter substrate binding protein n=1 Tax=Candidatus Uabimicrobium helgolandensis TaxID=3095367 RepID=UPI0035574B5C
MTTEHIGRYRLIREIGCGGMGKVYEVYDPVLRRKVALKLLLKSNSNLSVSRFLREAQSTAKLDHKNIIKLHEIEKQENGQVFYTMDFIEGESFSQVLKTKKLNFNDGVKIVEKVTRAVYYAHLKGIIHRDIKPGNIMIDRNGEPRLMDFGLAKELEGDATKFSQTGIIMGTVGYMPPEQVEGKVQTTSDIYALGAVLYKILTGKVPFESENSVTMIYKILQEEPKRPREWNRKISKDLEAICLKAIAKDPQQRYTNAGELADDLKNYLKGDPVNARQRLVPAKLIKWIRRNKNLAIIYTLTTVVLILTSMMSVFLFFPHSSTKRVLLLFSYESDLIWDKQIKQAIMKSFEAHFVNVKKHLQIEEFYMNTKKLSSPQQIEQQAQKAIIKINEYKPHLIIAADDNASSKVIPHFFNSDIQFVFCGVNNNPKKYNFPQKNVTGITEQLLLEQTFKMLPYFLPKAKSYALILEDSVSANIVFKNINKNFSTYNKKATLKSSSFKEWKKFLKQQESQIDFFLVPIYLNLKDEKGNPVPPKSVMNWILDNIKKPPIGALGFNIEDGALLGVVDTGAKQGKTATTYAIKILTESITAGTLPIKGIGKGELYINTTTAKHYDIKIPSWVYQFAKLIDSK